MYPNKSYGWNNDRSYDRGYDRNYYNRGYNRPPPRHVTHRKRKKSFESSDGGTDDEFFIPSLDYLNNDSANTGTERNEASERNVVNPEPERKPAFDPVPVKKPAFDPVPAKKPAVDPIPVKKPAFDSVPVKKPAVDPIPVKKPAFDSVPVKKPAFDPIPVKKPAVGPKVEQKAKEPRGKPSYVSTQDPDLFLRNHLVEEKRNDNNEATALEDISLKMKKALEVCDTIDVFTPKGIASIDEDFIDEIYNYELTEYGDFDSFEDYIKEPNIGNWGNASFKSLSFDLDPNKEKVIYNKLKEKYGIKV